MMKLEKTDKTDKLIEEGWFLRISGADLPVSRGIFCPRCGEPIETERYNNKEIVESIDDEVRRES